MQFLYNFFMFQVGLRHLAPKILQLLTEWTETFPYDFRDERMMCSLKELTQRLASGDEVSLRHNIDMNNTTATVSSRLVQHNHKMTSLNFFSGTCSYLDTLAFFKKSLKLIGLLRHNVLSALCCWQRSFWDCADKQAWLACKRVSFTDEHIVRVWY